MAVPQSDAVLREDALNYPPSPRSVSLARRRAARLVTEWGQPPFASETALVVSELSTNALLHGSLRGRLFRIRLALTASAVRIEVSDTRRKRLPRVQTPAADEPFGRGLLLIDRLADRWGTMPRNPGKTVWAELDICRPATAAATRPLRGAGQTPPGTTSSVAMDDIVAEQRKMRGK
ncbi:ATP-binding protein [Streptomyces sp. 7N604]|uniref:ATP-binding protein n=1 Tax=Streptomyces sp. 7N604 TaxID=3457415 RepID=UPI003FD67FFD